MRLFFPVLAFALILTCTSVTAQPLAEFSSGIIHIRIGENMLVKTYVRNPDPQFANITIWLGGDYPTVLAKFSPETGLYLTPDQRNLTVDLNPEGEKAVTLVILSTAPKDGGYTLTLNSNTTASTKKDFDSLKIFIDYPPSFPGLEFWGILVIIAVSCFAYWRLKGYNMKIPKRTKAILPVLLAAIMLAYLPLAITAAGDTAPPSVYFVPPTDSDGSTVSRDWSYVNVSVDRSHADPVSVPPPEEMEQNITIYVTSILCDNENLLPNWGAGGADITASTAADYVNSHPGCRFAPGWNFQWGPQVDPINPTPPMNWEPPNPGDQAGYAPAPWKTFGYSDSSGVATITINESEYAGITGIWVREVFQNGYNAFSGAGYPPAVSDVSAEFWCDKDVLNYDNYEYIDDSGAALQTGKTYYCVAFNVPLGLTSLIDWNRSLVGWWRFEDDTAPPFRSSGSPVGTLRYDVTETIISLTTEEPATCRYSTSPGVPYSSMTEYFSTSDDIFHTKTVGLERGRTYNYYVRCQDAQGNANADDYTIYFSVGFPIGNIILNPNFEGGFSGTPPYIIANSWSRANDGSVRYVLSQDAGYQGSAQKINITTKGSWGMYYYQTPTFELNMPYRWQFWYKTEGDGTEGLAAEITNATDTCNVFYQNLPATNGVWTFKDITFTYNKACANQLRFISNSVGSYWIDQVLLENNYQPGTFDDCAFFPAPNRIIAMFNDGIVSSGTELDAMVSSPVFLPAGHYKVWLMSYDGYLNRVNVFQPNERYFAKFYNGANLVAQSNSLTDLEDYVTYTNRVEEVNSDLYLAQNIDTVVAYHSVYPDATSANSVQPICAAFDRLDPPGPDGGTGGCSSLFTDSSTWGNDGTCSGSGCPPCVYGKFGKGLQFDGTDDYVNVGDPISGTLDFGSSQDFTVIAWVKTNQAQVLYQWPQIICKISGDPRYGYEMGLYDSTVSPVWYGSIWVDGVWSGGAAGASSVLDGQWHQLVMMRSGSNILTYQDGAYANTGTGASTASIANSADFRIGAASYNDYYFNGSIDEVRIFSRALSPEEINASYNAGLYRLQHNFTGLVDGIYTYRAYAQDAAGNVNSTETRTLTIQTLFPPPPTTPPYNLAMFSAENIHIQIGESMLVKAYVKNPDPQFANITIWLGGDYPTALAKFSPGTGLYLTPDQRNATLELNPKEERGIILVISSTDPSPSPPGYYTITMNANTTASSKKDSDSIKVFIDYFPSFPALECFGIVLALAFSGLIYWKIQK